MMGKFVQGFHTGNTFLAKLWQKSDPLMAHFVKKPETPELKPPTEMPTDSDDEAMRAARRRKIAEIQARSGRASTILSQSDQLGG
jgi:hypothetical protein